MTKIKLTEAQFRSLVSNVVKNVIKKSIPSINENVLKEQNYEIEDPEVDAIINNLGKRPYGMSDAKKDSAKYYNQKNIDAYLNVLAKEEDDEPYTPSPAPENHDYDDYSNSSYFNDDAKPGEITYKYPGYVQDRNNEWATSMADYKDSKKKRKEYHKKCRVAWNESLEKLREIGVTVRPKYVEDVLSADKTRFRFNGKPNISNEIWGVISKIFGRYGIVWEKESESFLYPYNSNDYNNQ